MLAFVVAGDGGIMANKFKVGDIEIIVVSDGEAKMKGTDYFPASTPETWEPHKALRHALRDTREFFFHHHWGPGLGAVERAGGRIRADRSYGVTRSPGSI